MIPIEFDAGWDQVDFDDEERKRKRKAEYDLMNETEKKQKTCPEHLWLLYDAEAVLGSDILYRFSWTLPAPVGYFSPISGYSPELVSGTLPPQIQSYIRIAVPPDLILDMFTHLEGAQIRKMLDELPGMYIKDVQNIILGYIVAPKLARFRVPEDQFGAPTVDLYDAKGVLMAFEPEDPKTDVIVYYDPALLCDSPELSSNS